jgi:tetratricopeptide (TPR) repeat protein
MRAFGSAVLVVWSLASAPSPVRAQTAAPVLDRNAFAVQAGQRGLEAFRLGNWEAAYQAFREAEATAHSPVFLLYMARARQRQGASAEALDLYARVAAEPAANATPGSWRAAIEQAAVERAELRASTSPRRAVVKPEAAVSGARPKPASRRESARSAPTPHKIALSAGVIGAAGLLLGATAGIVAKLKLDQIEANCTDKGCNPADKPKLESVRAWERVANVGFIVAGTGLATAGVFLWLIPATPKNPTSATSAGLSARWAF